MALEELPDVLRSRGIGDVVISPANASIRTYHYIGESDIFIFFNEGSEKYKGEISLTADGYPYIYNAWNNRSGFICYEKEWVLQDTPKSAILEITDAYEGIEVFVNGQSLEIQIVPVYLFDLTSFLKKGSNQVRIEVATTLEREMRDGSSDVKCRSGISGNIIMWLREDE